MLTLNTVKQLQAMTSRPSVTLTLPTHRTSPDNQKDPIRLKNLMTEAVGRLEGEFGKRETQALVARMQDLAVGIDHEHNLDGLVLFASEGYAGVFKVPYRLPERVAIDDNFLTRDLVFAMNRTPLYWVLLLSEDPTRLYLGRKTDLSEVRAYGFPIVHTGPGGKTALQTEEGANNPSRERDRALAAFMRDVDAGLGEVVKAAPFPVALVGVSRNLAPLNEVGKNLAQVVAQVEGGHTYLSEHELGQLVWPQVREALRERRRSIFGDIERAVGQNRFVTGLNECWQAAQDGRVETMVVEEDLHHPAEVSADGRSLTLLETGAEPGERAYADAVDQMIELVMARGGRVVFVEDGELAAHSGLVMLTRY
ncbi:hypothetical protein [Deinococcus planocerae]|uniref:AOC03_06830 family ribosome hibernation factor n=1 Tax=Deinococcus planocerae TaxID=1737569 RepID=UPI000C7F3C19|nr:hypothetical protein [Deinococcus planocerae]